MGEVVELKVDRSLDIEVWEGNGRKSKDCGDECPVQEVNYSACEIV